MNPTQVFFVTIHKPFHKWYNFLEDSTVPVYFNEAGDICPYIGSDALMLLIVPYNAIFDDEDLTLATELKAQQMFLEVLGGMPPHLEVHDPAFDPNTVRTVNWYTEKDGLVGLEVDKEEVS